MPDENGRLAGAKSRSKSLSRFGRGWGESRRHRGPMVAWERCGTGRRNYQPNRAQCPTGVWDGGQQGNFIFRDDDVTTWLRWRERVTAVFFWAKALLVYVVLWEYLPRPPRPPALNCVVLRGGRCAANSRRGGSTRKKGNVWSRSGRWALTLSDSLLTATVQYTITSKKGTPGSYCSQVSC